MSYFPVFIESKDKRCVIIGGGRVAYRKFQTLIQYDFSITVIAPAVCDTFVEEEKQKRFVLLQRKIEKKDLEGADLVIVATDQPELNHKIVQVCKKQKILVNSVTNGEEGNFMFPALVKRDNISVGINTAGKSPVFSQYIKEKIQAVLPEWYGELNEQLGELRQQNTYRILPRTEKNGMVRRIIHDWEKKKRQGGKQSEE